jgi:glycosyltransferase involved in cell wall biosynthesis
VEKYIKRCAESLFAQQFEDMEFIFVDDCTPDRSMEVLQTVIEKNRPSFAEMKWTIRTERMPQNSGLAAVRKYGVAIATGDYIAHCDSDDWLEPSTFHRMYDKAVTDDLDMVFCDYYKSSDTNRTSCSRLGDVKLDKEAILRAMLTDQLPTHSLVMTMCRKTLYNNITYPTGSMAEDWCTVFQLLFLSNGLGYVREPLYNYYTNASSISFNPRRIEDRKIVEKRIRNCRQMVDNCNIVFDFIKKNGATAQYERFFVNTKLWAKRLLCRMVNDKEIYRLWMSIYPEIKGHVLLNKNVTFKHRIMYLATWLRVYPLLTRLFLK